MLFLISAQDAQMRFGDNDWDVVTFPRLPYKAMVGSGTSGYAISKDSTYKDKAVDLLSNIVSEEGQRVIAKGGNLVPVLKSLANDDCWKTVPTKGINQDAFILFPERDMIPIYNTLTDSTKRLDFDQACNTFFSQFFSNKISAEDAVKQIQRQMVEQKKD